VSDNGGDHDDEWEPFGHALPADPWDDADDDDPFGYSYHDDDGGSGNAGDLDADPYRPYQTAEDDAHTALPPKVEAWRKRSAAGAILTGFALGLQQVFDKEREQPAIIMQTSGDPPTDLPVEATVEQGRPRQSVVNVRPWLLRGRDDSAAPGSDAGASQPGVVGGEDA
jgi:hypothetical protein